MYKQLMELPRDLTQTVSNGENPKARLAHEGGEGQHAHAAREAGAHQRKRRRLQEAGEKGAHADGDKDARPLGDVALLLVEVLRAP